VNCVLCRDEPLPGFTCSRCGAATPGERARTASSRGKHGPAPTSRDIRQALAGLAELARRRHGKHQARQAADDFYADQLARHTEHPQSRGSGRKLWSRP
jgi:hypothetical protein